MVNELACHRGRGLWLRRSEVASPEPHADVTAARLMSGRPWLIYRQAAQRASRAGRNLPETHDAIWLPLAARPGLCPRGRSTASHASVMVPDKVRRETGRPVRP